MTYFTNTSIMLRRSMEAPFIPMDILFKLQLDPEFDPNDETKLIHYYIKPQFHPLQQPQFHPLQQPQFTPCMMSI